MVVNLAQDFVDLIVFAFKLGLVMSVVLFGAALILLVAAFWPGPHGVDRWQ